MDSFKEYLKNLLSGLVPNVKTFAMVTWENPVGDKLSETDNIARNNKLRDQLANGAYAFYQIKGSFGEFQNPFIVMNITRKNAVKLGKSGNQKWIVVGNNNSNGLSYDAIECLQKKGKHFDLSLLNESYKALISQGTEIEMECYNIFHEADYDKATVEDVNAKVESDILNEKYDGKHQWLFRGSIHEKLET